MKNNLILLIVLIAPLFSSSQTKELVQTDNLSDIIAKSIYIYRNTLSDTNASRQRGSILDIKENVLTLDTLISIQISEYLKLNNAIRKALNDKDKLILDTLGELHQTLITQLSSLFEKGKLKKEKEKVLLKNLTIKHYEIKEDEENNLYGTIINNTEDKVEIYLKVITNKNINLYDKVIPLQPNEFFDLDKIKENFKSCNFSVFAIIKYNTKYEDKVFTNTAIVENIEHKLISSKFVIDIKDTELSNNSKPLTKEIEKYFKN